MSCTVLIGDDHEVVREGLRGMLGRAGFVVVGEATDGRSLVTAAAALSPQVIIIDISMPSLNGIEALRQIREQGSTARIIFLTMHHEVHLASEALRAGGSGYVLKDSAGEELIKAIHEALRGRTYVSPSLAGALSRLAQDPDSPAPAEPLTRRQREVLQLLAEGRTVKEVAGLLNVSTKTVEFHKYRIMERIGVRSVVELTRYAVREGIVD